MELDLEVVDGTALAKETVNDILEMCRRAYDDDLLPYYITFLSPVHVLGRVGGELASHALWVTRYLQPEGLPLLRTAYVEMVATEPRFQGRGYAQAVMKRVIAEVGDFDLAGLSTSSVSFYEKFGWQLWRGPLSIRTAAGLQPDEDEEILMVHLLPHTPPLDLDAGISAEWREGELW